MNSAVDAGPAPRVIDGGGVVEHRAGRQPARESVVDDHVERSRAGRRTTPRRSRAAPRSRRSGSAPRCGRPTGGRAAPRQVSRPSAAIAERARRGSMLVLAATANGITGPRSSTECTRLCPVATPKATSRGRCAHSTQTITRWRRSHSAAGSVRPRGSQSRGRARSGSRSATDGMPGWSARARRD